MRVNHEEVMQIIMDAGVAADLSKIDDSTSLTEAGVDSLDMANVLLGLEERYGIKISDDDAVQLDSVNAIVNYLNSRA